MSVAANVAHDMAFGTRIADDGVRFRLWAPAQEAMAVEIESPDGTRQMSMTPVGDGWFEQLAEATGAGDRYRFVLGDGTRVPDPASRFQPNGVHGPSEVIDPRGYAWQRPAWSGRPWREAVVYEAHVGAFTPAGSYDGMRGKLDHLVELGVTALELMPVATFDGRRNWGYDGVLAFAPAPVYGRPADLKRLVDAAHARGLMVLLDVVYNHFGPSGNYLPDYAPSFFTNQWNTPWGDAINFGCAEVRQFFIDNALYWLEEYRFDGLRLDAVDEIHDTRDPDFLTELAATIHTRIDDRHVHLLLENYDNAASRLDRTPRSTHAGYTAQWNDDFHHAAHVLATGEHQGYYADYQTRPAAALARALADGFVYQGEFSMYRARARGEPSGWLPPNAFVDFLQNHDQIGNRAFGERLSQLADKDAVKALTAICLLAPAVPALFMGEEWGAAQPFRYFCDYAGELGKTVCEGRREEFAELPAFADPSARERIPDPNAEATFTESVLEWRASATLAGKRRQQFVRDLLAIRRSEIEPWLDDDLVGGTCAVFGGVVHVEWPLAGGAHLHLAANLSAQAATAVGCAVQGTCVYSLRCEPQASSVPGLPPWSVLWTRG